MNIFDKVSTAPNKTSYHWKDSFSLLSYIILHIIYIARLFSLLQWVKYFVRLIRKYSVDKESVRVNVPSIVVEIYYLILTGFFFIITIFGHSESLKPAISYIALYFFIESILWVLYYFFFRRFFEEKYAIMHTLEYIVLFPLVILLQSCCMSIVFGYGILEGVRMLISPSESTPVPFLILSVVYTAVILGLIISNLPVENVKEKGDYRHHFLILGYGDVVKNRLMPAIIDRVRKKKEYTNVVVYDMEKPTFNDLKTPPALVLDSYALPDLEKDSGEYRKKQDLFRKRVLASQILWIATPPFAHLKYVESMYYSNQFMVVEKPITTFRNELDAFEIIHKNSRNIFCLSYYLLEKALPLTFLYKPLTFYEYYLVFKKGGEQTNDSGVLSREDVMTEFLGLGKPSNLEILIAENKEDGRKWAFEEQYGGQTYETFIHPLVLARLILGTPIPDNALKITKQINAKEKKTRISAKGGVNGIQMNLAIEKNAEQELRHAILSFPQGSSIEMDFGNQELTLISGEKVITICVKEEFKTKYAIQLDMVNRCFREKIDPSIVDGSDLQIDCLRYLMDCKSIQVTHES